MWMRSALWVLVGVAILTAARPAAAAYIGTPPLLVVPSNASSQAIGSASQAQGTIPLIVQPAPLFAPVPSPPLAVRPNAIFPEAIGRPAVMVTDGRLTASLTQPNSSPSSGQSAIVVTQSPNPALQCPYTAAISQTASATNITNQGNKYIHVCSLLAISTTQQGVSLAEGTGTACATGQTMLIGAAGGTAQVAANGGFVLSGDRVQIPMQKAGDNLCVLQSSTGNISGYITYGVY
jgi:hypothetical protein